MRLAAVLLALHLGSAFAVEINQASEADLDGLRGLGPATTREILAERRKAPFASWADLMARVRGLGPAKAAQLSGDGVTVAGQPYAGTHPKR